ncbi:sugar ABC transporter permease [Alicyclobacillus sp.]|uniref:carbohydrate ABC transporter permease n=1 Tax=Alicyclobacillus sp. TaxID=61169 RepID=UPI0025C60D6E|nr:sugar ABC transporter permease [Alicyclobacillus sp.]
MRNARALPWFVPLILVVGLLYVYPVLDVVRLSFTNAGLLHPGYQYTLRSYVDMLRTGDLGQTLWITIVFVFFSVVFQLLLGFFISLAIIAGEQLKLRGTVVVRTAVLAAWAMPGVMIGIIWRMLMDESPSGILNFLLSKVGIGHVAFLSSPSVALVSVIVANIWRGTAFSMIMQYAGLKTIPDELYEAAKVDGATSWRRLVHITVPMMAPLLMVNLILITISTFNTFDMIMALTGGGPGRATEVMALSIYDRIFHTYELGGGAAMAVVLLVINLLMAWVYMRMSRRTEGMTTS